MPSRSTSPRTQEPAVPESFPSGKAAPPTVAIVGGGLAGLAAACALSDSQFRVSLFERRPYLGGRASSYQHPATGEVVDNCQHVLFELCTNLIDFYRKIGIEEKIRWFDSMTFIEPGGRQSILRASALPAPFHLTPAFLALPFLNAHDKFVLARALTPLLLGQPKDNGTSFQDWLIRHHQTPAAIERFWKPILVSALSEDLDRISLPYAAQVVRESMKSRDARRMGIPMVPLTDLYSAACDFIVTQGGEVRLRNAVESFQPSGCGVRLRVQGSEEDFEYVVLAVPFDSLTKLLPDSAESAELREKLSYFESSSITGVHFWFDREITRLPHAVLLDRTIQWMFHKSRLLQPRSSRAQPDHSFRNNSADLEPRYDYLELVISSSKALINKSRQEVIDLALAELREFFPAASEANLVKAAVIKEVNATFSPKPGIDDFRPPAPTRWPRIFLAGDWTATGWPATMEGAVRSGYLAAEAITKTCGSRKQFLAADLPPGGFMRFR